MYHLVLLLAAAALLGNTCNSVTVNKHSKILDDINNHIESDAPAESPAKGFLSLRRIPPPRVRMTDSLELTCEAIGMPAPSIRWFRDNAPIYEYDKESNEVIDSNPSSLAKVSSTLLVANVPDSAQFTCLAFSGHLTTRAHTTVYNDGSTERTERSKLVPLAPRILLSYKVLADTIGGTTRLPCAARGHPRPKVTWRDVTGAPVTKNPRMKVLRSGELVISPLEWTDMSEYTCTATNLFGSAEIKTFLYPAKPNESDG